MKQHSSLRHARPPGFTQTLSKEVPRLPRNTNAQRRHPIQTPPKICQEVQGQSLANVMTKCQAIGEYMLHPSKPPEVATYQPRQHSGRKRA